MYTHTLREAAWEASKPSSSPYRKKKSRLGGREASELSRVILGFRNRP